MSHHVVMGAVLECTMGASPSALIVTPEKMMLSSFVPAANIMDHIPIKNILPFVACKSPANVVALAAAAVTGVPACIPVTPAPWVPGSPTVLLQMMPCLNKDSKLQCVWGGTIQINFEGQATEDIP
jgi:hypothetical protein